MFKFKVANLSNLLQRDSICLIKNSLNLTRIKFNFAKQAKQPKESKKSAQKQQPKKQIAVEDPNEKLDLFEKYLAMFKASTPTISPSQRQAINNNFSEISQSDKELLDILADKILDTNTTIFYDFAFKKGGLGTSQAFYAASSHLTQQQIHNSISILRKDI